MLPPSVQSRNHRAETLEIFVYLESAHARARGKERGLVVVTSIAYLCTICINGWVSGQGGTRECPSRSVT